MRGRRFPTHHACHAAPATRHRHSHSCTASVAAAVHTCYCSEQYTISAHPFQAAWQPSSAVGPSRRRSPRQLSPILRQRRPLPLTSAPSVLLGHLGEAAPAASAGGGGRGGARGRHPRLDHHHAALRAAALVVARLQLQGGRRGGRRHVPLSPIHACTLEIPEVQLCSCRKPALLHGTAPQPDAPCAHLAGQEGGDVLVDQVGPAAGGRQRSQQPPIQAAAPTTIGTQEAAAAPGDGQQAVPAHPPARRPTCPG